MAKSQRMNIQFRSGKLIATMGDPKDILRFVDTLNDSPRNFVRIVGVQGTSWVNKDLIEYIECPEE